MGTDVYQRIEDQFAIRELVARYNYAIDEGRPEEWVGTFVQWYNDEHRHSAIGFVTPAQRHAGQDIALLKKRVAVYEAAKAIHPGRWSGATRNWKPVLVVHLNPEKQDTDPARQKEQNPELKKAA